MADARRQPSPAQRFERPDAAPPRAPEAARLRPAGPARRASRALPVVAASVLAAATAFLAPCPAAAQPAPPSLDELPAPPLERMEPAVRRQIETALGDLRRLAGDPAAPATELAAAFGHSGRLYLLYGYAEAAAAAFRNAHRLAPEAFEWPYYLGAIAQGDRRLEEALEHFAVAARRRPDDPALTLRSAQVRLGLERFDEAVAGFRRLLPVEGYAAAAHHGLGQAAFLQGRYAEAAGHFEKTLELQPAASAVRYQLALCHRELGDAERARRELARRGDVEVAFPDPLRDRLSALVTGAGVHLARAARARQRGDVGAAVAAFREAIAADPEHLGAREALASTLAEAGEYGAAASELEEVLRRDPDSVSALYNLAGVRLEQARQEEARRLLERAVEVAPDYVKARRRLAALLAEEQSWEPAAEQYAAVLRLDPRDVGARLEHAAVLERLGRAGEALAELEEAVAADPGSTAALLALAGALERSGRAADAAARYEAVLELAPSTADAGRAHLALGGLSARQGDLDAAGTHLDAARATLDGSLDGRVGLARLAGQLGRFAEAAADFDAALATGAGREDLHFGRAISLLLGERYAEAAAALESSLAALPGSLAIRHALAQFLATCPDAGLRDGERALELASEVLQARRTLDHAETVAMAYAELGRFAEAIDLQRQVVEQARAAGEAGGGRRARRLASYESGRPVRAPWLDGRRQPAG